ncbi:hypothetical protein GCM10008942_12930 [Rhizomicrobium electricum]|uniref:Uncharacterized protein n=1 Tax=Rhizomicrobium electricum TaxID=480070 RepID=A0ABN1EGA5_9PROT
MAQTVSASAACAGTAKTASIAPHNSFRMILQPKTRAEPNRGTVAEGKREIAAGVLGSASGESPC